jgi:ribonuclease D
VLDEAGLEPALEAISGHSILGIDTETTGLDPFASRVRLIQIATPESSFVFDLFRVRAMENSLLKEILSSDRQLKVFHNAKFDLKTRCWRAS